MKYDSSLINDIGFDIIRDILNKTAKFFDNKIAFLNLSPFNKIADIIENQNFSTEIIDSFTRHEQITILGCNNIDSILNTLKISGSILGKEQFKDLKIIFQSAHILKKGLIKKNFPLWNELTVNLYDFKLILKQYGNIFDNELNVKQNASRKLQELSEEIKRIDRSILSTADKVLKKAMKNGWHMGDKISWKNNRIVIPINHSYKNKIQGVIQDVSQTGQTVFIEPLEVVELNNAYNNLLYKEKREIAKILLNLTTQIHTISNEIKESYHIEKKYDYHFTIAEFSNTIDAIKPNFNTNGIIEFRKIENPIFKIKKKPYVPLDLIFENNNLILISGPNAGGKTVVLKTLGLACFMAQCGLFIPGKLLNMPIFDYILSDIGDNQSIENDLSTFSSHISNINSFLKEANDNTLILIDELGTGTDPQAGAAIAMTLMQEFINKNCFILATTHLGSLKIWAENSKGSINSHMMFDPKKLKPIYSLSIGKPGSSYAIEVLKSLGVKQDIINKCSSLMKKEDLELEKILINLQKEYKNQIDMNKELDSKLISIKQKEQEINLKEISINKEFKKAKHRASKEAEHIIKTSRALIEKTIENIKSQNAGKNYIKEQRAQIDEKLKKLKKNEYTEEIKAEQIKTLIQNMPVFIPHLRAHGIVIEISSNKKNCKVLVGSIKLSLNKKDLYISDQEPKTKEDISYFSFDTSSTIKIDLRGERVEQAIEKVEKFLDTSIVSGNSKIYLLHGKGTGALISGIHEFLKEQKSIEAFYFAEPEFGGSGVTIIDLL